MNVATEPRVFCQATTEFANTIFCLSYEENAAGCRFLFVVPRRTDGIAVGTPIKWGFGAPTFDTRRFTHPFNLGPQHGIADEQIQECIRHLRNAFRELRRQAVEEGKITMEGAPLYSTEEGN